jgi:hypothetical protein
MADINLISFIGPVNNGQTVDMSGEELNGLGFTDTVKCTTELQDFTGKFGLVIGGNEDCIDVNNRCKKIDIFAKTWKPTGKHLATIKGGSEEVCVRGDVISHGEEVDVDLGNWSDQSQKKTKKTALGLISKDGEKISIRVLKSEKPTLLPNTGPYKYVFPWPWLGPIHTLIVSALFLYFRVSKKLFS